MMPYIGPYLIQRLYNNQSLLILITFWMDWYPQQLFTAEKVAAGSLTCLLTEKVCFGEPQPMFMAERVAAGAFLLRNMKCLLEQNMCMSITVVFLYI